MQIIWTDYFKYRVKLRGFNLVNIEEILRYSTERYYDCATDRLVVVGNDEKTMVLIPYEKSNEQTVTPITVHATNRQQINYRVRSGRFTYE
jgi:hypothetical protein